MRTTLTRRRCRHSETYSHPRGRLAGANLVADTIEMAVAALAQARGEAKIIAGGQSLVPMLNFRLLRPAILVDINRIRDLAFTKIFGAPDYAMRLLQLLTA